MSTIAVIPFFFAKTSSSKGFSGKNDISTTSFLFYIIVFNVWYPIKPGTALTIMSYIFTSFDKSEI